MIRRDKDLLIKAGKQGLSCYLPNFNTFSRWMLSQILSEKLIRLKIQLKNQHKLIPNQQIRKCFKNL